MSKQQQPSKNRATHKLCVSLVAMAILACGSPGPATAQIVVWDNGVVDGSGGERPTANWDPLGIVDDIVLPSHGQSAINFFRIEQIDGTQALGQPSLIDSARIRLYGPLGAGLAGIDLDNHTPVFDHTYTEASGEMTEIDSGMDFFGRDLFYFDLLGPSTGNLAAGQYGMVVSFPGQGGIDSFWGTSDGLPDGAGSETAAVIGSGGLVQDLGAQMAFGTAIPEPATLSLLPLSGLALIRRRRRMA